jgi:hypothetical protein
MGRIADAVSYLSGDDVHREVPAPRGIGMEQAGVGEITAGRTAGRDVNVRTLENIDDFAGCIAAPLDGHCFSAIEIVVR